MSYKYAPPFATLALVQKVGGGGLYAGCDNFSRDYALPSRHEVIVGGDSLVPRLSQGEPGNEARVGQDVAEHEAERCSRHWLAVG